MEGQREEPTSPPGSSSRTVTMSSDGPPLIPLMYDLSLPSKVNPKKPQIQGCLTSNWSDPIVIEDDEDEDEDQMNGQKATGSGSIAAPLTWEPVAGTSSFVSDSTGDCSDYLFSSQREVETLLGEGASSEALGDPDDYSEFLNNLAITMTEGSEEAEQSSREGAILGYTKELTSRRVSGEINKKSMTSLSESATVPSSGNQVEEEVREAVDYMIELVVAVVPFPEKPSRVPTINETVTVEDEDDDDIQILDMAPRPEGVENIVCEVQVQENEDKERVKRCLVCDLEEEKMNREVLYKGQVRWICSNSCYEMMKSRKDKHCASCNKKMEIDSQGYLPNFSVSSTVSEALCSSLCLMNYEKKYEPKIQCFKCNKTVSETLGFFWQTMDFCSSDCVVALQTYWGASCACCRNVVSKPSLGKYSVRFGDVIKQFCAGSCLEKYKRNVRVCAFCQKELSQFKKLATFGSGDKARTREFCNDDCLSCYRDVLSLKSSQSVEKVTTFCSLCQCLIDQDTSTIKMVYEREKYLLCSTTCVAAFKYTYDLKSLVCENCNRYDWKAASLVRLNFGGSTKVFCSKRCQSMFVLKIRKIVSCLCCKVKKYSFDMIEWFNWDTSESRLFCSVNCYDLVKLSDSLKDPNESKAPCASCHKSAVPMFRQSLGGRVMTFCSYPCVFMYQSKREKHTATGPVAAPPPAPEPTASSPSALSSIPRSTYSRTNILPRVQPAVGRQFPVPSTAAPSSSTMWTPSFSATGSVPVTPAAKPPTTSATPSILLRKGVTLQSGLFTASMVQKRPEVTDSRLHTSGAATPVISSVVSLAPQRVTRNANGSITRVEMGAGRGDARALPNVVTKEVIVKEYIVKPQSVKSIRSMGTQFRASTQTKAIMCRPRLVNQSTQTD